MLDTCARGQGRARVAGRALIYFLPGEEAVHRPRFQHLVDLFILNVLVVYPALAPHVLLVLLLVLRLHLVVPLHHLDELARQHRLHALSRPHVGRQVALRVRPFGLCLLRLVRHHLELLPQPVCAEADFVHPCVELIVDLCDGTTSGGNRSRAQTGVFACARDPGRGRGERESTHHYRQLCLSARPDGVGDETRRRDNAGQPSAPFAFAWLYCTRISECFDDTLPAARMCQTPGQCQQTRTRLRTHDKVEDSFLGGSVDGRETYNSISSSILVRVSRTLFTCAKNGAMAFSVDSSG